MSLGFSIVVLTGLVFSVFHYWSWLGEHEPSLTARRFLFWVGKGVLTPLLLWLIVNCGILMQPILPEVQLAMFGGRKWFPLLLAGTAPVLLVIGFYWAAFTFVLLLQTISHLVEERRDLVSCITFWSALALPLAGLIVYFTNWAWAGFAVFLWLLPVVHSLMSLLAPRKILPSYSRAIARIKFGKYNEAELEVLQQLEKSEDDFDGWLMLADLYANHFSDLREAEKMIHETCAQPNITPSQIAVALHRLADWHLKLADDPVAACRALEGICQRYPGSHLARMARQRIERLPKTQEKLREQRQSKPIHLPALNDDLDDIAEREVSDADRKDAATQANQWVDKLKQDPDDVPAREELARLFAERLGRADLAVEQIGLLMQMPDQADGKKAGWLSLIGAWQIKYLRDPIAARGTLEQLIRQFPQSAQAFAAQRRLSLLDAELKMRARTPAANTSSAPDIEAADAGGKSGVR